MDENKVLGVHPLVGDEWESAVALMSADLEGSARDSKALQRRREVRSASDLLRLVLGYALGDWSLRLTGLWATLTGLGKLSDVAVLKRLRACLDWLRELIGARLREQRLCLQRRATRLRLIDATVVSGPGSRGTDWRVHLSFDMGQVQIDGIEVTDAQGGETLVRHPVEAGDVIVADRGYAHPAGLGSVLGDGGQLVVRINWQNLPLEDADGQRVDLINWLQGLTTGIGAGEVWLWTPQGRFALRLVARRLSEEAADAARRRLTKQARKKGRTPDRRSLIAASFVMVVTNLSVEQWSDAEVLDLYRLRWQIELLCKRLKSLLDLDQLRARSGDLAQVYLLGKLLAALLIDALAGKLAARWPAWGESQDRPVSPWRQYALLHDWLRSAVRGVITLERILAMLPDLGRYLRDSPRQRRQQCATARTLLRALVN